MKELLLAALRIIEHVVTDCYIYTATLIFTFFVILAVLYQNKH